MLHFDEHIFQMGWFNHQLEIVWTICLNMKPILLDIWEKLRYDVSLEPGTGIPESWGKSSMLNLYVINYQYESLIYWVWPLRSNSDHQVYYIFNRESPKKTFIYHCYWEGVWATPSWYKKNISDQFRPAGWSRLRCSLLWGNLPPKSPQFGSVCPCAPRMEYVFYLHSPWIYLIDICHACI